MRILGLDMKPANPTLFMCDKHGRHLVMGCHGRHQALPVSAAHMCITQILLDKVNGLSSSAHHFLIPAALLNTGLIYLFLGVL